ncbi:multidrug effflux MFS transporter [Fodinicurvata sp. EGI_FJ10296]|uniref:multidrug effflux MFS transporter n=1 Tax=Fodinicurvata sp. EGI_FJ10296 TaxID=3231908 RepID=UPI0034567021
MPQIQTAASGSSGGKRVSAGGTSGAGVGAGTNGVRRPSLFLLVSMTALGPLALNIFMPSMPGLGEYFGAPYGAVQLTLSVYLVGMAVSQLIYGPLSDRFGRRPLVLAGLAVYLAGTLAAFLAPTIEILIAARFLQAIGGSAGIVLGRAIVRDLYERDKAASMIAYVTMAMVVAPMVAPLMGGFIDTAFGWRASFALLLVAACAVLALTWRRLPETNHERIMLPGIGRMAATYAKLLRNPVFLGYTAQTAAMTAGFFAFLGGAPYVVVELMDRSPGTYGLYFIMTAIGYMAGNFTAGRISQRLGVDRMMAWGVAVTLSGAVLMLLPALAGMNHPLALFLPMVMMTFGNGLVLPNGMAGAISVSPGLTGSASGLSGFIQMGIGAAVSVIVGILVTTSALPMLIVIVAVSLGAVGAHIHTRKAQGRQADTAEPPADGVSSGARW